MADNNFMSDYRDLLKDKRFQNLMKEIDSNKGFKSLYVDIMMNANRVLPSGYPYLEYMFCTTTEKLRENDVLQKFLELTEKYADVWLVMERMLYRNTEVSENAIYKSNGFTVCGHDYFFHGTTMENYKKILETGYIKFTNYLDNVNFYNTAKEQDKDRISRFRSHETGNVFITDSFITGIQYATDKTLSGAVLCLDLDGFYLENLYERNGRKFMSKKIIPVDRLKKVYRVDVVNNQIELSEMEVDA